MATVTKVDRTKWYVQVRVPDHGRLHAAVFPGRDLPDSVESGRNLAAYDEYWDEFDTAGEATKYARDMRQERMGRV